MNSILLVVIVALSYIAAYFTYGRYIGHKIFNISTVNKMPSEEQYDGVDFVPATKEIVFGHHFTTIAGLGPVVGPAIGIIWGWVPALLWVVLGSIFMGAVHDFSTLVISARNRGKTIGELTGSIIGNGPRLAFQLIIQLLLVIVLSVFALIVSTLFIMYPQSVVPIWIQIPLAIWIGKIIRKQGNKILFSILALLIMYFSIYLGVLFPVDLTKIEFIRNLAPTPDALRNIITLIWCVALYIYVFIASTLPVHYLLQPRDFINAQQLFVAMILIIAGIFVAHPDITAPAINHKAFNANSDVPSMAPMLFIIIACGALSGFHSIASSGTTVKQVKNEKDTLFVGFGSMLTEGFLAFLVILCVAAGLGLGFMKDGVEYSGIEAYNHYYTSWASANAGIGAKIQSFIIGASNLFKSIGIPISYSFAMIAVFIVSFANTTLDSATRIQRLALQELLKNISNRNQKVFTNRYFTTFIVVLLAGILTFAKPGGKGALILWPLFGGLNQLLAALGLAVVSVYLYRKKKNYLIAAIPMLFVLFMTIWSLLESFISFLHTGDFLLATITIIVIILSAWLLAGGIISVRKKNKMQVKTLHRNS